MLVKDQKKFVDDVTTMAIEQIEVKLRLDTRHMDAVMHKLKPKQRFKFEEKMRKELSETKSCFLTLYNNNPFYELDE